MYTIRYVQADDQPFWFSLDRHLSLEAFMSKVRDQTGYVLLCGHTPVGLLRYHLFWDNTPFCTLLMIEESHQRQGCGTLLLQHWEREMKAQGFGMLLTSTRVDEQAQHFYRKLGYADCGGLLLNLPGYEQPMELFLAKPL